MNLESLPEILTPDDAARFLRVTPRKIKELCHDGEMGCHRIGKKYRIGKNHVMAYLEKSCQKEILAPSSNGERIERLGKYNGSMPDGVDGVQLALTASRLLKSNSRNTSRGRIGRKAARTQTNALSEA